jgi:hypothetical protein
MKIAKTLAVLAAMFLVGAVAIGTLGPEDMTLGEGLAALDQLWLAATEHFVRVHMSAWLWEHPLKAVLARPLWLLPAAIGLILVGGSATAATTERAPNSRRRRS